MQTEHRADSLRMGHCFDGTIRARRYLCRCCKRTVSLLPEFALPYLRFGIVVIAMFLVARILLGLTLKAAAEADSATREHFHHQPARS
jgi:hypothetical protein